MALDSTSPERTYRYVRLAIVVAALAIGVSVVQVLASGEELTSISAVYYTPGKVVFVGALFAVAAAFVALSGHSLAQALIDLAAIFAVLIAVVPTGIPYGSSFGVPDEELPAIANGMTTFAVIGGLCLVLAVVLAAIQKTLPSQVVASITVGAVLVAGAYAWWLIAPDSFATFAHVGATVAFFVVIAVVAGLGAFGSRGVYRWLYAAIAVGIVVDLGYLVLVLTGTVSSALVGEAVALTLFAFFWIIQTVQNWSDPNPTILA